MIPILEFLIVVAFALSPFLRGGAKYLSTLKDIIARQSQVQQELRPGSPTGLPGLDEAALRDVTARMEALGFTQLEDHLSHTYSSKDEMAPAIKAPIASPSSVLQPAERRFTPQGFARVMVHSQFGCLGKIIFVAVTDNQGIRPVTTSFSVGVSSFTGMGAEDWAYVTTSRNSKKTANALMKFLRMPRRLSTQIPGASPEEVLRFHLERRETIAQVAGVSWKRAPTLADDYASEERSVANIRAVYGKLTSLELAWKLYQLKRDTADLEWLGELKGRIPNAS